MGRKTKAAFLFARSPWSSTGIRTCAMEKTQLNWTYGRGGFPLPNRQPGKLPCPSPRLEERGGGTGRRKRGWSSISGCPHGGMRKLCKAQRATSSMRNGSRERFWRRRDITLTATGAESSVEVRKREHLLSLLLLSVSFVLQDYSFVAEIFKLSDFAKNSKW